MNNMFNINGFEVKAVNEFRGHDGQPLIQGNLYYNNKKVGFLSDDDRGGLNTIRIREKDIKQKFNDTAEKLKGDKESICNAREFLYETLFFIKEVERLAKQKAKKNNTEIEQLKFMFPLEEGKTGLFDSTKRFYILPKTHDEKRIFKKEEGNDIVIIDATELINGLETYKIKDL